MITFATTIAFPPDRLGDERDVRDPLGQGPMHDAAARPDMTADRWQFSCPKCHAKHPLRADTALRLYLKAIATAALTGNSPRLALGES